MVDWNKDVKLSDLIARKQKEAAETTAPVPEQPTGDGQPATESSAPAEPTPSTSVPFSPTPPAPPAATQAVPMPEPDLEPEPEAPAAERVPWYKREVSLGGGKGDKPKAQKSKQRKEKRSKEKQPTEQQPKGERVPFYKRELSFGGKESGPKEKPPKGERVPFYKRELSYGGKKSATPKVTSAPKGKSQKASASPKRVKRVTGLKIGGSQLAAARVHNNGVPELVQVARQELDPGVVVGGELRDPDALSAALKDFFKRHKLPRQGVRLGIANNRIGVRIFDIAGIDDVKQLENAVRFRAHEALPIPIEDAVIDWQVLGEREEDDGTTTRRIMLVVAYRELLDRYVEACKKAGIRLVGIDLEAFALLRVIAEPLPAEAGPTSAAIVVVSVGHDRSTFAVSDGRVCEFTRVLDWGGAS